MRVRYDPDADVLLVEVREGPVVDAVEEPGGVIVSYGEDGEPVSVEFLNASERGMVGPSGLNINLQAGEAPA
jgi:uncharacterized protein YuzE